ncbi:MAG: hypothetical protein JW809_19530 [Pirellulales bacterium]|nr:hypothetical protein [Pirellulales bacterium]
MTRNPFPSPPDAMEAVAQFDDRRVTTDAEEWLSILKHLVLCWREHRRYQSDGSARTVEEAIEDVVSHAFEAMASQYPGPCNQHLCYLLTTPCDCLGEVS